MSRSGAFSDLPVTISCGQCIGCRLERSRQWAVRCVHEAQMHDHNCFLTLTYDNEHLPADGSINPRHWQLFAKKLRKAFGPFRFFHCGEYGDENNRPHYHASIFGLDFFEGRTFYRFTPSGDKLYEHPALTKIWGQGTITFGDLTFNTAAYVARYIMKKQTGAQAFDHYLTLSTEHEGLILQDLHPEYVTMSRKPGIGKTWIDKYMDEVYPSDEIIIRGRPGRPPKFYDQQYEKINTSGFALIRKTRAQQGREKAPDNLPDRLLVREEVKHAETNLYARKL